MTSCHLFCSYLISILWGNSNICILPIEIYNMLHFHSENRWLDILPKWRKGAGCVCIVPKYHKVDWNISIVVIAIFIYSCFEISHWTRWRYITLKMDSWFYKFPINLFYFNKNYYCCEIPSNPFALLITPVAERPRPSYIFFLCWGN